MTKQVLVNCTRTITEAVTQDKTEHVPYVIKTYAKFCAVYVQQCALGSIGISAFVKFSERRLKFLGADRQEYIHKCTYSMLVVVTVNSKEENSFVQLHPRFRPLCTVYLEQVQEGYISTGNVSEE